MRVSAALLEYLRREGVKKVFGIPGGAIMHVVDELDRRPGGLDYVLCRHEGGAAFMADAYARVGGGLGVVLVTSGPGATNALCGVTNAARAGTPVLLIAGEVPRRHFGKGYLQEGCHVGTDLAGVFQSSIDFGRLISDEDHFHTLFAQGLRHALTPPFGASFVSLPDDVAAGEVPDAAMPGRPDAYRARDSIGCPPAAAAEVLDLLAHARRPLLLLGNGTRRALRDPDRLARFVQCVEALGVPVATTGNAKGVFPESHPLSLRNFGLAACLWTQRYLESGHDALVVIGSSLSQLGTRTWDPLLVPKGSFLQIDLNAQMLGRAYPLSKGIVADAGALIDGLSARAATVSLERAAERTAFVAALKAKHAPVETIASGGGPGLAPQVAMKSLQRNLPTGAHVFVDAGNCVGWTLHFLEVSPPTQVHYSLGDGPMGFGVAGVVGGQLADATRRCLAVVGDGAFLMHGTEVSTAASQRTSPIWLVLNDDDHSMVRQGMDHYFPKSHGWRERYALGRPDLVRFAQSLGAQAYRAESEAELDDALAKAIAAADQGDGPQVVVLKTDPGPAPPYYPRTKHEVELL